MEWKGRRQSDNVEDHRGDSGGRIGGDPFGGRRGINLPIGRGGSVGSVVFFIVVIVILHFMGVDVGQLLGGGSTQTSNYTESQNAQPGPNDEMKAFVGTVLAETEDAWNGIFAAAGRQYSEPRLVLFSGSFPSACGTASSATGPFYCPPDQKVYLDTDFFREMSDQFGASGDFAQAYVIAHEVGHHVQNLIGVLPKFNRARQSMSETEANAMSVRVELQADCFAGIWAKFTDQRGLLEAGDIDEALNAAHQIGDDALQKKSQGYVVPDSFTHGSSAQRAKWFRRGYESGKMSACDTFSGRI
ncbi:neutral zinc metallopeptidase [Rhizobium sp. FKL33]|uniref:KPN_02809 family neutral zinc metallopeptidase n=1 Tax=Rhizobium sp. FKL33 TaxID=2562307 RepID=UPI0010BFB55C|nr:neutral zinc metallopeptidase [Rhizobium sp. FKL33]